MSNETAVKTQGQPLQWLALTLAKLPTSPEEMAQLKDVLGSSLIEQFTNFLPPQFRPLVGKNADRTSEEQALINSLFDKFLIGYAAETFGPRLLFCELVVKQLMRWDEQATDAVNGTKDHSRMRAFCAALVSGSEVRAGTKAIPVSYLDKQFKPRLVSEVRRLRELIKNQRFSQHRPLTFTGMITTIENHPDMFGLLATSIPSLRALYTSQRGIVERFMHGSLAPSEFVNRWMADWHGISYKHFLNRLSQIRD